MKITINNYHAIALWRWNLKAGLQQHQPANAQPTAEGEEEEEEEDDDDDDDVCGICRVAYDGCCPDCKTPGDECPLIWGECTHVFHMHCIIKWLDTESSKQQCPMDRRPWVTAGAAAPPPDAPPAPRQAARVA
ncbi:anaphase-promoting complex subunit 11 [Leucosporidium creatinivorum]|uniref:Anaphase-promoting complex subunit 11 n=1 Tax=Leucosporidium creatinivorum TaxID=106004 RepID=A0A1Y2DII0_9BASI|nr:anaphase-promoting complex subunit 11 [Leucosporidium creatinivorum]